MMKAWLIKDSAERYEWAIVVEGEQGFYGMLDTENARDLLAYDAHEMNMLRFHRLSFGGSGHDAHQIVDMELIWLAALMKEGLHSVGHMVASLTENFVWSTASKPCSDWDAYEWVGRQCGVDFMIEAYLDGVSLEHILPDVEFEPDVDTSEYYKMGLDSVPLINLGSTDPIDLSINLCNFKLANPEARYVSVMNLGA